MKKTWREQIALFRYGVISDLVSGPLAPGEKEQLLGKIAAKQWQIPGTERTHIGRSTVRDWIAQYEALGFEGLQPAQRRDAGRARALPEKVQQLLLQLRLERPKASVRSNEPIACQDGSPSRARSGKKAGCGFPWLRMREESVTYSRSPRCCRT